MELIIIACLILLNGLFAMSEIALISARKSKLENEAKQGSQLAQAALNLSEKPENFLSTVQIGITLIGILTGLYSGDIFARDIGSVLSNLGVAQPYAVNIAKIGVVIIVTYLTIIFGELVPKRIAMTASENVAKIVALPMKWLSAAASPFVWVLEKSTKAIFGQFKMEDKESKVTEEEIKSMLQESQEDGEIEAVEQDIVERVFSLGDRAVSSIMTHRGDIAWIDVTKDIEFTKQLIRKELHDIYPACQGSLDKMLGIVYLKNIFAAADTPDFKWEDIIQKPHFFHESTSVYTAMEYMKANHLKFALVSDEFGDLQGIISLKDILEALIGLMPEEEDEPYMVQRQDGSWLVAGQCPFYDFLEHFNMENLYTKYEYNTLSGMIIKELGHIPKTGETFDWQNIKIEIADMDRLRIDKIIVTLMPQEAPPPANP